MSNETTQLQKAIVIAVKDRALLKYPNLAFINTNDKDNVLPSNAHELHQKYTTDLNYLMPIASRISKDLARITDPFDTEQHSHFDTWMKLDRAYMHLTLDPNNQYTELFEALYNAVKLLEA